MPIILEKDALHTAPATLPPATEVNAIEDCTVDGKKHKNKKPKYSASPKSGCKIGFDSKPNNGNAINVKAKTKLCKRQCKIP